MQTTDIDARLRSGQILILGGSGFLGARIVRRLVAAGIRPHLMLRPESRTWRLRDLLPRCRVHIGDLTDLASLRRVFDAVRPGVVIHTAGHGSHAGENVREALFAGNLLATHNLLLTLEAHPLCRLIYSSTSLSQGKREEPLTESIPPDPITYYAAVKTAATILVQQAARHEGRPIVILRPFAIYGPGEPGGRLIPTAIRAALQGRELAMTPPGYVRDPVFVDDVADAYLRAAAAERLPDQTINIAGGRQVSNEAIVAQIEKASGRTITKRVGAYPPRATDTSHWCADIGPARTWLHWSPSHTLEQGIAQTLIWFETYGFNA